MIQESERIPKMQTTWRISKIRNYENTTQNESTWKSGEGDYFILQKSSWIDSHSMRVSRDDSQ
jgi:hypothetical protein